MGVGGGGGGEKESEGVKPGVLGSVENGTHAVFQNFTISMVGLEICHSI